MLLLGFLSIWRHLHTYIQITYTKLFSFVEMALVLYFDLLYMELNPKELSAGAFKVWLGRMWGFLQPGFILALIR